MIRPYVLVSVAYAMLWGFSSLNHKEHTGLYPRLTLVAATNVFLFEPSFNFAVEQQAINRVYRFVTTNTIEEKIVQITTEGMQQQKASSRSKKRKRTSGNGEGGDDDNNGLGLGKGARGEDDQNGDGVNQLLYLLGIVKNADELCDGTARQI
eukprot:jgi/Bigna1/144510/aug1.88_g19218